MEQINISVIYLGGAKHTVYDAKLTIDNYEYKFSFDESKYDLSICTYIVNLYMKKTDLFIEDTDGHYITLKGCIFPIIRPFNDLIANKERINCFTSHIDRVFIGEHYQNNSLFKSLNIKLCYYDESLNDRLNYDNKLDLNKIFSNSFQFTYNNVVYDICNENEYIDLRFTCQEEKSFYEISDMFWCFFDLVYLLLGYCLKIKKYELIKSDGSRIDYLFRIVSLYKTKMDLPFFNIDLLKVESSTINENTYSRWADIREKAKLPIHTFFSSQADIDYYDETKFTLIASSLEGYYKSTKPNTEFTIFNEDKKIALITLITSYIESNPDFIQICDDCSIPNQDMRKMIERSLEYVNVKNLRTLLTEIFKVDMIRDVVITGKCENFINKTTNTRNYLAHLLSSNKQIFKGTEIHYAVWKLSYIYRLFVLNDLELVNNIDEKSLDVKIKRLDGWHKSNLH